MSIKKLKPVDLGGLKRPDPGKPETNDEETSRIVDMLFDELMSIFPAHKCAFETQHIFDLAKKNWFLALKSARITSVETIKVGLNQARKSTNPFFPSCGQFVLWCSPSSDDLGMPSKEDAYDISQKMNRQFPEGLQLPLEVESVIKYCLKSIGRMEYRMMTAENSRKTFYYTYELALKRHASCGVDIIPRAIPRETRQTQGDRERAMKARDIGMESLKEILNR